jgi:hypothetical protein
MSTQRAASDLSVDGVNVVTRRAKVRLRFQRGTNRPSGLCPNTGLILLLSLPESPATRTFVAVQGLQRLHLTYKIQP